MERFIHLFTTIFYLIGAATIGYYTYSLRLAFLEEGVIDLAGWFAANAFIVPGLVCLAVALIMHSTQVNNLVSKAKDAHLCEHRAKKKLGVAERELADQAQVLAWAKGAIDEAVAKDNQRKAEKYEDEQRELAEQDKKD